MSSVCAARLAQERKSWRVDHPADFYAKPVKKPDGSNDIMNWEAGIPGKVGTDWEGGVYKVRLIFGSDYPGKAPQVVFTPPIFHPNVFTNGAVCLSILKEGGWKPSICLKELLLALQEMLDTPNALDPANGAAAMCYLKNRSKYSSLTRDYAAACVPDV